MSEECFWIFIFFIWYNYWIASGINFFSMITQHLRDVLLTRCLEWKVVINIDIDREFWIFWATGSIGIGSFGSFEQRARSGQSSSAVYWQRNSRCWHEEEDMFNRSSEHGIGRAKFRGALFPLSTTTRDILNSHCYSFHAHLCTVLQKLPCCFPLSPSFLDS